MYLLDAEGHQDGGALGGEGAGGGDGPHPIGQGRVQAVLLLVAEDGELADLPVGDGQQGLGVRLQLFQRVSDVYEGDVGVDHALVPCGEVIKELLVLRPQLLQVIGDSGRKIVLGVLALLPAGNIALHSQNSGLNIPDGLPGGDRQNVDGQHQVFGEVGEFGDHLILDVTGVVPEEQDPAELAAHLEVVHFELHPIRADIVPEVVA